MSQLYSPLETIPNFRDVGRFVNEKLGKPFMKTGMLYRGARPEIDEASPLDREKLVQEYGVKSIVDLRTKTEHIEQSQKRDARIAASAAVPQTNNDAAEPLKIPGIKYHEINFNGSAYSRMLISKLSWVAFFKLIYLMLIGRRLEAISIITPSMEKRGLVGLSTDSLDVCVKEVKMFFEVLSREEGEGGWPVMVHCTQGKDRTGLTIMLVLFVLGVPTEIIDADYMLSDSELVGEREERIKDMAKIGLSERFARCPLGLVAEVEKHIKEKYGGVDEYLEHTGVRREMREKVKGMLLN
ncbi:tyrosine/serine phosphatase-like protein [Delitschia confertaspora ATCC 74209]|uniref:Tyrosine/serine phosphatase-like protein n=1 Tax=Delitschia confertaspora ATCC 74209 TaxID=1513339 RepID=A0A9P4MV91_9PLEO|nr:tyrosine/serine phosphatase-like protein [Delitschia confertaspora ATCC 74209]